MNLMEAEAAAEEEVGERNVERKNPLEYQLL